MLDDPDLSAVLLDSTIVRVHVSPLQRVESRARPQPGRFPYESRYDIGSTGLSLGAVPDGRSVPRQHPGLGSGGSLDGDTPVLSDRRPGL